MIGKESFKYYVRKKVGGVRKRQFLLIYSTIYANVGGWVGPKKPKTWCRNTWMVPKQGEGTEYTGQLKNILALTFFYFSVQLLLLVWRKLFLEQHYKQFWIYFPFLAHTYDERTFKSGTLRNSKG